MAHTGNSIVDFLSSQNQASDYGSRSKLAQSKGIQNYTGSADQNTQLLNLLRGSGGGNAQPQPSSAPIQAPGAIQTPSFEDTLARAQQMTNDANKPVISQLQSSIPDIQKQYGGLQSNLESQRQPLKDRYDQLLQTVKNNQTQAVNKQTTVTNNELGKRGILGSSGAAQQEIVNATEPINQNYTALGNDVGFQGQQAQQDITNQEAGLSANQIADIRAVNQAIAQAQAGGNQNAVQLALSQQGNQQQLAQNAIQNALAQEQLKVSQANSGIAASTAASENELRKFQIQQNDPAYIGALLQKLGIGQTGAGASAVNPGLAAQLQGFDLSNPGGQSSSARPDLSSFIIGK